MKSHKTARRGLKKKSLGALEGAEHGVMGSGGKRRQMTLRKQSQRQKLLAKVLETKEIVKAEKEYGRGLASMNDISAAVGEIEKDIKEKALKVRFTELSKSLGKTTLTSKTIAEQESKGIEELFNRWKCFENSSLAEIYEWVKKRVEDDASERKIKLENYNDLKATTSIISGISARSRH